MSRTKNTTILAIKFGSAGVVDVRNIPFVKTLKRNLQQHLMEGLPAPDTRPPPPHKENKDVQTELISFVTNKNTKRPFFITSLFQHGKKSLHHYQDFFLTLPIIVSFQTFNNFLFNL